MKIIVVAGASGAGKSHLLQEINEYNIKPIKKMSTRPPRESEKDLDEDQVDLIFNCKKKDIIEKCGSFVYNYKNNTYGINTDDLDQAMLEGKIPIVIVRNCETIQRLKEKYSNNIYTIYIHTTFSGEELVDELKKHNRVDIDIRERDQRTESDLTDFQHNPHLFNKVLFNNFKHNVLSDQFRRLLDKDIKKQMVKFGKIFTIMSFDKNQTSNFGYMESAVTDINNLFNLSLQINRIDISLKERSNIINAIEKEIKESELIICDLTDNKPNVFYELGFATALKKKCLLLTQYDLKDLPFDIKVEKTSRYTSSESLKYEVKEFLRNHYANYIDLMAK